MLVDAPAVSACAHPQAEIRYKLSSAGKKMFARQCLDCGASASEWLKHAQVPNRNACAAWDTSWDEGRRAAAERAREAWQEREEQLQADKQAQSDEWWEIYNEYLRTDEWKRKSKAVVKRDVICRACSWRPAKQAHHLTYKHAFNEPLFDLVGVCEVCHPKITEMDRDRRYTTGIEDARAWRASRL